MRWDLCLRSGWHMLLIMGIPNYIDFASNNEQGFVSVPKGILKLPKNLGV